MFPEVNYVTRSHREGCGLWPVHHTTPRCACTHTRFIISAFELCKAVEGKGKKFFSNSLNLRVCMDSLWSVNLSLSP